MDIRSFVFFLAWGLVGLTGLIWSLRNLWLSLRSNYWNEVDCEIIESDVKVVQLKGRSYRPIISYKFNIGGLNREGHRIKYGATWGSESVANAYCEKYPVGKIVKISFDPMHHNRSVLEPGASWSIVGAIILSLAALAIGLTGVSDYLNTNH